GSGAALADARQDCVQLSGDAAISACDEAIRQNPGDANAYANRGSEYQNKGETDRAIADFNKAIEIDPRLTRAYNNRGNSY
ncbi:tetratricopeptide repeat protein, partial [Acinetobacter baumannii]